MTPPEERDGEWAGMERVAWGEIEYAAVGDKIHACVDYAVLLVILASAVGLVVSALGLW